MDSVIKSCKQFYKKTPDIRINVDSLRDFANGVAESNLKASEDSLFEAKYSPENFFHIALVFNVMNFCYWAEKDKPKWDMDIDGDRLDGSIALVRLIEKIFREEPKLLEWKSLSNLELTSFKDLFCGSNTEIPLLDERHRLLVSLARNISEEYGDTQSFIDDIKGDASILLDVLSKIESFRDFSIYNQSKVIYLKRAQLQVKMYSDYLVNIGKPPLKDVEKLSAFADYKIPQLLRHLGVLEYSSDLSEKVDDYVLIDKDSSYENQIRISTILAIDLMAQHVHGLGLDISAADIDGLIWSRAASNEDPMKPYHRTYTTSY